MRATYLALLVLVGCAEQTVVRVTFAERLDEPETILLSGFDPVGRLPAVSDLDVGDGSRVVVVRIRATTPWLCLVARASDRQTARCVAIASDRENSITLSLSQSVPDSDGDGVPDFDIEGTALDNCPATQNADQLDSDEDGEGDACGEQMPPKEDPADAEVPSDPPDMTPLGPPDLARITKGFPATSDCTLDNTARTSNSGGASILSVEAVEGTADGKVALMRFDLTMIPPNAVVDSAEIVVHTAGDATSNSGRVSLHQVHEAWSENVATWSKRTPENAWSAAGCGSPESRAGQSVGTIMPATENTTYTFADGPGLRAVVQSWIASANLNSGLSLVSNDTNNVDFVSQNAGPLGPQLKLTYHLE